MNKPKFVSILLFVIFVLFVSSKEAFAAFELSISADQSNLDKDTPRIVTVNFSGDSQYTNKLYYLRAVLSKPGSTSYFGFTENNAENWISTTNDKTEYFAFTTDNQASWSGQVRFKYNLDGYDGPGDYELKVGRYTSSGDSGADWSAPLLISLTANLSTATPIPTPSPTPTPTPTPTKTPTPTPKPTVKAKATTEPAVLGEEEEETNLDIGTLREELSTPEPSGKPEEEKSRGQIPLFAGSFVVLGLGFTAIPFYPFLKKKWLGYTKGSTNKSDDKKIHFPP